MTSRQAGRRIGTVASNHRFSGRKKTASRPPVRRKQEPMSRTEKRIFLQLVTCGGIFVLLVAVKLLLPGKMAQWNEQLSGMMQQNMDVQTVFSAVGRAFSGEEGALEEVYQAVFHPQEEGELVEASAPIESALPVPQALDSLRAFRVGASDSGAWLNHLDQEVQTATSQTQTAEPAQEQTDSTTQATTLAYVLYSDQNLPENVSMEQAILGFDYCTPVVGTLTSNFGYREHPVEGEERFHYGLDIAANTGTAIGCFADGTVTAVGESSSYGKYLIVAHEGGYSTLYAHCSKIVASSGAAVNKGQTIAEVGETGIATGPHLHFELHRDSDYLNPIYYVSLA